MNEIIKRIIFYALVLILSYSIIFGILKWKISKLEYTPIPPDYEIDIDVVNIERGDIFASTFEKTKISKEGAEEITKELRKSVNLGRIVQGDFYKIVYSPSGEWTHFWYYPRGLDYYSIKKSSDGSIISQKKALASSVEIIKASGKIETSLWEAMSSAGIPANIIMSFADIFAWQLDFLTDPRKGDTFKVAYETTYIAKKNTTLNSRILAAEYKTSSKNYNAFYFKTKEGDAGYFDKDGKSVKSAFLKAPLQFKRISSHFSRARFHPVLKFIRPHLGIDYAAPTGTPVSTIGDGVVTMAQRNGGFGNYVEIKHSNGYVTSYGHLSKYGKGIKKGVRVSQGQVIGYVGTTGVSTGPHLDFRIKKDGKFFNYLTMKQPPATTLSKDNEKEFKEFVKTIFEEK
ncbi:MAG: M23 family metallopeptidase [Endomicrobia bacterium]|nr:M23 family metallopeptidase [Endomicrobiia bacterium]MCL2506395.1 M23 family metallopeptidase [Endomicrobiia bacterium]